MRSILFDDLSLVEEKKIRAYLSKNLSPPSFSDVFWLDLPKHLLSGAQKEHADCLPYSFGLELTENTLSAELLVRSRNRLHCTCMAYATPEQRAFLLDFLDTLSQSCALSS